MALIFAHAAYAFALIELDDNTFRFSTDEDASSYYVLQATTDLHTYYAIGIDFGINAPIWEITPDELDIPKEFYRVGPVSLFAPKDSDGDRIDDVYEMLHPEILNALDPSDANVDHDFNGKTHLQEYLELFGLKDAPQFYAREVSVFNYGAPISFFESISREYSIYNLGSPSAEIEAVSKEISVYNGSGIAIGGYPRVASREISIFNAGSPSASIEAVSKEISIYNGSGVPLIVGYPQIYSREISTVNLGEPTATFEAISREISVNALKPAN